MSTKFTQAEGDTMAIIRKVIGEHHHELKKAQVKIDCLFASNEDNDAITLHGYKCAAVVRKISYKNRVMGRGDAEITIDALWWEDATDRQKEALISHELTHLQVVYNTKTNAIKRDGADRPKLSMRLHDWQLGGFEEVAKVFGKDAPEVVLARDFKERFGQLCFDFGRGAKKEGGDA